MFVTGDVENGGLWQLNETSARLLDVIKAHPHLLRFVRTVIVNGQYSEILALEELAYRAGESSSEGNTSGDESENGDEVSMTAGELAKWTRKLCTKSGDRYEKDTIPQKGSRIFNEGSDAVKFVLKTFPRLETLLVVEDWWDWDEVKGMLEKKRSKWKYSNKEIAGRNKFLHVRVVRRDPQE